MEVVREAGTLPNNAQITATTVSSTFSAFGTMNGSLLFEVCFLFIYSSSHFSPSHFKSTTWKSPKEVTFSSSPIEKICIVERWDLVFVLSHSTVDALSLKSWRRESFADKPVDDAICFTVDEASDRIAVCSKRTFAKFKRLPSTSGFESQFTVNLDDPCQDVCLACENGLRFVCISAWEGTYWLNTDQGSAGKIHGTVMPACDFLQVGRSASEVVLVKGNTCWFSTPFTTSSDDPGMGRFRFSDALWQVLISPPYLIGCLHNNKVEIVLENSGQLVQTVDGIPAVPRFRFSSCCLANKNGGVLFAGSVGKQELQQRVFLKTVLPLEKQVGVFLSQRKTALALALAKQISKGKGVHDHLLWECQIEHACALLLTRPACSLEDVQLAISLLAINPPEQRILRMFANTELFDSRAAALKWLDSLFPPSSLTEKVKSGGAEESFARFQPGGVLSLAVQHLFVPLVLPQRGKSPDVDSVLLRAFALSKNRFHAEPPFFSQAKHDFFESNTCGVEESEALLLSFPEMWQEHASLLAGKGLFEKALEWLSVLGKNATQETDAQKYALAALSLLSGKKPELAKKGYLDWILHTKAFSIGIDGLVTLHAFTVEEAKAYFETLPAHLYKMYLERSLLEVDCPPLVRDELADIYLQSQDNEALFLALVERNEEMNLPILLPKLDHWPKAQARVLDRMGKRKEAAFTLATKCSVKEAEQYAELVKDKENTFQIVFDGILSQSSQLVNAEMVALDFLARYYDSLQGPLALKSLGDDLAVSKMTELFHVALACTMQTHREHLVERELLKTERFEAMKRLAEEKKKYIEIHANTLCKRCCKAIKPDSPVMVFQSQVWHFACFTPSEI